MFAFVQIFGAEGRAATRFLLDDLKILQGDHVQLSFFKNFKNGKKFMKSPKPSDKNAHLKKSVAHDHPVPMYKITNTVHICRLP